jgi:hypothetical protein
MLIGTTGVTFAFGWALWAAGLAVVLTAIPSGGGRNRGRRAAVISLPSRVIRARRAAVISLPSRVIRARRAA